MAGAFDRQNSQGFTQDQLRTARSDAHTHVYTHERHGTVLCTICFVLCDIYTYDRFNDTNCEDSTKKAGLPPTACDEYCAVLHSTPVFMGGIHPYVCLSRYPHRSNISAVQLHLHRFVLKTTSCCAAVRRCRRLKRPVGERLAIAAYNQVYGGTRASTGPTISGCKASASKLTLEFDPALLKSSKVVVQPIANITTEPTMLQVLAQKKTRRKRCTRTDYVQYASFSQFIGWLAS